jgi:HD superfamily phosphodiesterase
MTLVKETLTEQELLLWLRMCLADRSHSVMVAHRFTADEPEAPRDALAGVFLHDVGKTVARTKRFASYHDHEQIGAQLLREAGSSLLTIETALGGGQWGPALRFADDV